MNKEDIMKIVIFALAAIMAGGMFYGIQYNQQNNSNVPPGAITTGMTGFNGTIRTYDPFLAVDSQIPDSVLAGLRSDERVKSVTNVAGGYLINTTTRDDVFPLAQSLRENGIKSSAIASVILPTYITVQMANGTTENASAALLGSVRVITEPLVDADNDVLVQMIAVVEDNTLVSYSSARIVTQDVTLSGNGTVESVTGKKYQFTIPWNERANISEQSLEATYGNGSVDYVKNDVISFPQGLPIAQIVQKRGLPYITFISDTSASVEGNFTDEGQVSRDFGNVTVVFPDSSLGIMTNSTVNMSFNGTVEYGYLVDIPPQIGDYTIAANPMELAANRTLRQNDSIAIIIDGTAIGNKIVGINGIAAG
jgi:hypothetical protein